MTGVTPPGPLCRPAGEAAQEASSAKPAAANAHTPGPWIVNPFCAQVDCQTLSEKGGLLPVARMLWPTDERSEAETEANARLIAAAPAMLEALEQARAGLQAMLDAWLDFHDAHGLTDPVSGRAANAFDKALEARDQSDAAIALAKGTPS